MKPFGVSYDYDDDGNGNLNVQLDFNNEDEDCSVIYALTNYVNDLIKKYGPDEAYEMFIKADFRIYTN